MPALNVISSAKLVRLIGIADAPAIIDVRGTDVDALVPGALPLAPAQVAQWATTIVARATVVVDADGRSDAHGVAAWLRSEGVAAEILDGGVAAWRAAGLPVVPVGKLPNRDAQGRTLWVTRARPKVDRIACPWLIRRFVDPRARFLYVPAGDVLRTADAFGAAPFDVADDAVHWSHRGERCTFDLMVEELGLSGFAGLAHLATIVRGADTDRLDLAPEAAGLLAISLGLSRIHADDLAQLEAGMHVYDAFYRWSRDARDETHDWSAHQPRAARP